MNPRELFRIASVPRSIWASGLLVLMAAGFIFLVIQLLRPCTDGCDSISYFAYAKQFNLEGILSIKAKLRTFAYPWMLSLCLKFARLVNLPDIFCIFLFQLGAYFAAILAVTNIVQKQSQKVAGFLYLALCANIFVVPYTSITLTDSLYVSVSLLILALLTEFEYPHDTSEPKSATALAALIFLLCFAITIRPAAVWLCAPVGYCLVRLLMRKQIYFSSLLLGLIIGALPLYIQTVINTINFQVVSFFPVTNLGKLQTIWGIKQFKYATWIGGGPMQNFYPSGDLYNPGIEKLNIQWYFSHIPVAIKLLTVKFFGAFDFDYILPYPYQKNTTNYFWSFFSYSILYSGICGTAYHLFTNKVTTLGSRFTPAVIFLSWCAVTLITAIELRFTLPILTYFIVVGCCAWPQILSGTNKKQTTGIIFSWVVFLSVCFMFAKYVRLQSTLH